MPDFSSLLSKPADEIKKPVGLPEGSYDGLLTSHKFEEANTPKDRENPKKPVCNFTVKISGARDDVDEADLNEALDGKTFDKLRAMEYTFWLTDDAQYRVVECAKSMGIAVEGKNLGEIIQEMDNQPVIVSIVKVQSTRNPEEFYSNIGSLVGTAAA